MVGFLDRTPCLPSVSEYLTSSVDLNNQMSKHQASDQAAPCPGRRKTQWERPFGRRKTGRVLTKKSGMEVCVELRKVVSESLAGLSFKIRITS